MQMMGNLLKGTYVKTYYIRQNHYRDKMV